jgi:hypothetical protein
MGRLEYVSGDSNTAKEFFSMKKNLFIILGIFLVLGLLFTACSNDDSSDDLFNGTWAEPSGIKISATNGAFKGYGRGGIESYRGTYTVSGNTANGKTTEVNSLVFGGTGWVKYSDLSSTQKTQLGWPENFVVTIVNNTFTHNGVTFTKQ